MMLIDGKNEVYMIDRDNSIFHVANLEFPFRKDLRMHLTNTLLDGVRSILYNNCNSVNSLFLFRNKTKFLRLESWDLGIIDAVAG